MFRKVNKKILIIFSVILLIVTGIGIYFITKENNDSTIETLSKYGSRGREVTQIQTKLKRWGYYSREC